MSVRQMQAPRYCVFLHPCPHGDHDAVEVAVRKGWWGGPGQGGQGRELHRFCAPVGDCPESERVARALETAAASIRG